MAAFNRNSNAIIFIPQLSTDHELENAVTRDHDINEVFIERP